MTPTTLRDREPGTEASQVVIEQMASLVEQVRAIAFPEMVGQPIPQDDLRAALALIEEQAATEARRELLAKVEGLPATWTGNGLWLDRAAVLRLIEESV